MKIPPCALQYYLSIKHKMPYTGIAKGKQLLFQNIPVTIGAILPERGRAKMYTYHSIKRAQERTPYNGKAALRFIENGVMRGKTAEHFRQAEKEYLTNCGRDNCTAKAYNGFCLIVSERGDCVTLYPLPDWFGKKQYYEGKTRIRNVKRYAAAKAADA